MIFFDLEMQGNYQRTPNLASAVICRSAELRKESIRESFSDFDNIEHRNEFVARIKDVDYINDSKATNLNATWYALEKIAGPVIWIAGGIDKGNDYSQLFDIVKSKVAALICIGTDKRKLIDQFTGKAHMILRAETIAHAVSLAYRCAVKGDTVLLSPACASFDEFDNYEDRGRKFKSAVKLL